MAKKPDLAALRKFDLGEFEGKPVVGSRVIVRGTGDGLSKSCIVDPITLRQGQRCIVAFEADVAEIRYDPREKDELDGDQLRVHICHADTAMVLPAGAAFDAVRKALDDQSNRISVAEEEAAGIARLPGVDDPEPAGGVASTPSPKTTGARKPRKARKSAKKTRTH